MSDSDSARSALAALRRLEREHGRAAAQRFIGVAAGQLGAQATWAIVDEVRDQLAAVAYAESRDGGWKP